MNAQPLRRPIGFSPAEISSLVNETVVSQHAEEAAFLWTMRNRAVGEPHYSLNDIAALDERVEAHVDGLRTSPDVGWKYCKANLENLGPGEVFALSVIAFDRGDRERMREALHAGCSSSKTVSGLVSALGWLDFRVVGGWIGRLLDAKAPEHRAVGIAASAVHRRDPGLPLDAAVKDPDPRLRARAMRAVGELKRRDLCSAVRAELKSDDEACGFWAAWGLAVNGQREGVSELAGWFERVDAFGMRALQLGLRAMNLEEGRAWIRTLARKPGLDRSAVVGAGVIGDPASIPWLIDRMETPELARLAGEAFTMITGLDLSYYDLDQDPPPRRELQAADVEEVLDLDYESNLPWPSPARVGDWWQKNQLAFASGERYLAGRRLGAESLIDILRTGKQRQRAAAASELALMHPEQPLFEVRARGKWQQWALSAWNS